MAASKLRVFVMDDEVDFLATIAEVLALAGHDVETAPSVDGAGSKIRGGAFDVVMLDHRVDGLDSQSLLDELAAWSAAPSTILCSGGSSIAAIADRYDIYSLRKPFDLDDFLGLIERAAAHPRRPSKV